MHAVEDEMLCASVMQDKVPYFNAPIYLQNKSVIGKVDEILGPINEVYFSVKMGEGMIASSFKKGDKVYIGGDKLLPIERFLPKPKVVGGTSCLTLSHQLKTEEKMLVKSMYIDNYISTLKRHCDIIERRGTAGASMNGRGRGPSSRGGFQRGFSRGGRASSRGSFTSRGRGSGQDRGRGRGRGYSRGGWA